MIGHLWGAIVVTVLVMAMVIGLLFYDKGYRDGLMAGRQQAKASQTTYGLLMDRDGNAIDPECSFQPTKHSFWVVFQARADGLCYMEDAKF